VTVVKFSAGLDVFLEPRTDVWVAALLPEVKYLGDHSRLDGHSDIVGYGFHFSRRNGTHCSSAGSYQDLEAKSMIRW
jgi:hypothetical protein